MYSIMIYKIILDSYDALNYSGDQFNATYPINTNEVIKQPADLDKAYIMGVKIISVAALSTESGFSPTILYGYNLDLGKKTSAYQFNNKQCNCSGVLRFENSLSTYSSTTVAATATFSVPQYIKVDDKDFYIDSLRNINNIRFQVTSVFDNTQFISTDNTKSRYNIVLTFRPIDLV